MPATGYKNPNLQLNSDRHCQHHHCHRHHHRHRHRCRRSIKRNCKITTTKKRCPAVFYTFFGVVVLLIVCRRSKRINFQSKFQYFLFSMASRYHASVLFCSLFHGFSLLLFLGASWQW